MYSNPYYYPWIPYHHSETANLKSLADVYSIGDTELQLPYKSLPEWRTGVSEMRDDAEFGETTLPNYKFFQTVLKFVKKMRRHFIPVYLLGPDISSIYADQKDLSDLSVVQSNA